jgi:hypothetical protein
MPALAAALVLLSLAAVEGPWQRDDLEPPTPGARAEEPQGEEGPGAVRAREGVDGGDMEGGADGDAFADEEGSEDDILPFPEDEDP